MLFQPPSTTEEEDWVVARIDELRERLRHRVTESRRWVGLLRRVTLARNIRGSNSIEGYTVSLDDAVAAAEGEEPLDATTETRAAIRGYREAMTYVLQLGDDSDFEWDETLLRSLHYMMISYDLSQRPGGASDPSSCRGTRTARPCTRDLLPKPSPASWGNSSHPCVQEAAPPWCGPRWRT